MNTTENNYPPSTFLILALTGILAAVLYIFLVRLIDFEPIIIGPMVVVFAGVYLPARYLTKKNKINNYQKIKIPAVFAAIIAFLTIQVSNSYFLHQDLTFAIQNEVLELTISQEDAEEIVNNLLLEETGYKGLIGSYIYYLKFTTISGSSYSSSSVEEIGFIGGLVILTIELAIVIITSYGIVRLLNRDLKPFCRYCQQEKVEANNYTLGSYKNFSKLNKAIADKNFADFQNYYDPKWANKLKFTDLVVYDCPSNCKLEDSELVLIANKAQQRKVSPDRYIYTKGEFEELKKIIED
jgi:hypothetical protein